MKLRSEYAAVPQSPIAEAKGLASRCPQDLPLIDLSQAAPSHPPARALREYLREYVDRDDSGFYTPILGLPEVREALAADMKSSYLAEVGAGCVGITSGCNQAFCAAIDLLAGSGDEVLLPVPYYFNHDMWLRLRGIEPVYLPVGEDLRPSPQSASERITARTRAIVLVTPNNPTGVVCAPELIEDFYRLAREKGLALLVDETYRDFRPTTDPPHGLFGQPDWEETLIHLYSFSKVFALPGYRAGAIVAGERVLAEVEKWMDCVAICSPRISQQAARFGLLHLKEWREARRIEMVNRLERFRELLRELAPEWTIAGAGAYFAYLRHPEEGVSAQHVARRLLEERGLLTLWGEMFGPGQERFLRFAFANLATSGLESVARRLGGGES